MIPKNFKNEKGFTMVELLIATAISGIILAATYSTYQQQLRSYLIQEDVSIMQQDLRAVMDNLEKDLRNAVLDPSGNAGSRFLIANNDEIGFTADFRGGQGDVIDNDQDGFTDESDEWYDGDTTDPTERVRYAISSSSQRLGREWGGAGGLQPISDTVRTINFVYIDANGVVIDNGGGNVSAANFGNICAVAVTLIARGEYQDKDHTDDTVYTNEFGTTLLDPGGDRYRRRSLSSTIKCRNRGLRGS